MKYIRISCIVVIVTYYLYRKNIMFGKLIVFVQYVYYTHYNKILLNLLW